MDTAVKHGLSFDTYIILSSQKAFGHIIESSASCDSDSLFDIFDIAQSELEFIRRSAGEHRVFAVLTQTREALVFSRLDRSSYILGVCLVSIESLKSIRLIYEDIKLSPTLIRRLRKCEGDGRYEDICRYMSLYLTGGENTCMYREFIYKSILEYSSVYNIDVGINTLSTVTEIQNSTAPSFEMLYLYLHFLFLAANKCNTEKLDIVINDIGSANIIHSVINMESKSYPDEEKLNMLSDIANMHSVLLRHGYDGGKLKISICPYFTDDSQYGLKSKIHFDL